MTLDSRLNGQRSSLVRFNEEPVGVYHPPSFEYAGSFKTDVLSAGDLAKKIGVTESQMKNFKSIRTAEGWWNRKVLGKHGYQYLTEDWEVET